MPVETYTFQVLGLCVDNKNIVRKKTVRGCKHEFDKEFEYCPQCGKKTHIEIVEDLDSLFLNIRDDLKIPVWSIYYEGYGESDESELSIKYLVPPDKEYGFIGLFKQIFAYDDDMFYTKFDVNDRTIIDNVAKQLQDIFCLSKYKKLWDPDRFGLYTVSFLT